MANSIYQLLESLLMIPLDLFMMKLTFKFLLWDV